MQTAIGQGNTLVSPMHMALITSSIANGGVLMKPYLIDKVAESLPAMIVEYHTSRKHYKRLMTRQRSSTPRRTDERCCRKRHRLFPERTRHIQRPAKTGSAEYDESGASHSWFVGYSNVDNPDLVVAVIVEGRRNRKRSGSADRGGSF